MFRWQTDEHSLSRLIDNREIKGFLGQDAVIHPNEAVVVIQNGKIEDIMTQTRLEKVGGGFMNALRRWFDTGRETEFLFMDTTEKVINFPTEDGARSFVLRNADHDDIQVVTNMVFIADGRRAAQLYGLTKQQPNQELSISNLKDRIFRELHKRVLANKVRQYSSSQLGDISIINDIEAATRTELAKTFESWGINLLRLTTGFGTNAWEEMRKRARELELTTEQTIVELDAQEAVDERTHAMGMRADERGFESDVQEVKHTTAVRSEQLEGDIDFRDRERAGESRDSIEMTETGVEVSAIEHEQDMKEISDLIKQKDAMQDVKLKGMEKESEIDSKYIQETKHKEQEIYADKEKHAATMDAEKAKYNMETYVAGEERADGRARDTMEMFARTVEAAKPNVPHTYVGGEAPKGTYVDIHAGDGPSPGTMPPQERERKGKYCMECGAEMPEGAKFCNDCGKKFE